MGSSSPLPPPPLAAKAWRDCPLLRMRPLERGINISVPRSPTMVGTPAVTRPPVALPSMPPITVSHHGVDQLSLPPPMVPISGANGIELNMIISSLSKPLK